MAKERCEHGDPRAAIAAYRSALQAGGPVSEVELQLGALHAQLGERDRAETHLRRAIEHAPRDPDARCMLGIVLHELGRFDEAAQLLEQALDIAPNSPEAHFNLGLTRFERGDVGGAAASFARCAALKRGEPWDEARRADPSREPSPQFEPEDMAVNEVKLRHDCEQLEYLLAAGRLPSAYREVLADYRSLLEAVRGKTEIGSIAAFNAVRHALVARTYKRPILIDSVPMPRGPLVNPELDWRGIEQRYLDGDPQLVAVDGLFTEPALAALRRLCLESTFWNNIKPGYLGAYFYDGFCSELLLRAARELRERMPTVMRALPLQMMWGYKYQSRLPGISVHADEAAVNVNIWITEDAANLDPEHGGLLVYPQDAPREWGFARFNTDPETIQRYLDSVRAVPVRIPYRANRAVIFDSDLFHATDQPAFREGYANRRVNITFLYGQRVS
jgi:Tfp pilus assembly protein PilF